MNISNTKKINFKLIKKFIANKIAHLPSVNIFGLEKLSYNKGDKWELIPRNKTYSIGIYVSLFSIKSSFFIYYLSYNYENKYKYYYIEIQTQLNNKLLMIKNKKKFLWLGNKLNFAFEKEKKYYYDNNYNIAIIGYLGNSKDFWFPAFCSYKNLSYQN